jgi:hypothetical protein
MMSGLYDTRAGGLRVHLLAYFGVAVGFGERLEMYGHV